MRTSAIVRRSSTGAQDEATGVKAPTWAIVHEGRMRLGGANRGSSGATRTAPPGGERSDAQRIAHFPSSVAAICDGDLIEVLDGDAAGTVWRVLESDFADQQTARRLPVVAVPRPAEWGP